MSRSLTTAGVEVRSSSRTSTSTRNPRPTPGHPHSTRKSHIAYDYEPEFGDSAPSRDNGITHPDPVLLSSMTKAQRGAVCRYLARFAELDDAKIFYAYGHADELAAKEAARTGSFATV